MNDSTVSLATSVDASTRDDSEIQDVVVDSAEEITTELDVPDSGDSIEPQAAGEFVDGLRLDDIRWGDNGDYIRVVFDLSTTSGEIVAQAPHADATMLPSGTEIEVTLGGIRGISGQPNVLAETLDVGDPLVASIERQLAMDDQSLVYRIVLEEDATYVLASLGDPARVIVDIYR